jgi:hypothetical protein
MTARDIIKITLGPHHVHVFFLEVNAVIRRVKSVLEGEESVEVSLKKLRDVSRRLHGEQFFQPPLFTCPVLPDNWDELFQIYYISHNEGGEDDSEDECEDDSEDDCEDDQN